MQLPTTTLEIRSHLVYEVTEPASFAFAVAAARTARQTLIAEQVELRPSSGFELVPYGEGGTHQLIRLDADPGRLELDYSATVGLSPQTGDPGSLDEMAFREVSADLMPYLNPSRYCESDRVVDLAERLFGDIEPGYGRVQAISDWVHDEIAYVPGTTDVSSGTAEVLLQRAGVCRDFAHVAIAMCRALGVPARYVSGYGIGVTPQDFHGFFEAYLAGDWWLFDPTGMSTPDQLVRIGYGRDAADASFATFAGAAELLDKEVSVERVDATDATTASPDEAAQATA